MGMEEKGGVYRWEEYNWEFRKRRAEGEDEGGKACARVRSKASILEALMEEREREGLVCFGVVVDI